MNNDIWALPGGIGYKNELIQYIKDRNLSNVTVYDSFNGLPWNSGRPVEYQKLSMAQAIQAVYAFNDMGMEFDISMSSPTLIEDDLHDERCNEFLTQCHNKMNGIIIGSEILRSYVKQNYPKYKLLASITHVRCDQEYLDDLFSKYDMVIINPDINRNYELLSRYPAEKIEILVNEKCVANCPVRALDYASLAKQAKGEGPILAFQCAMVNAPEDKIGTLISRPEDLEQLRSLGIRHFKIQGRQDPFFHRITSEIAAFI